MAPLSEQGQIKARKLMAQIELIRAEHHACTAREVSRLLCMTHTVVVGQLTALRERGWVDWTEMTGSLRVTDKGRAWLQPKPAPSMAAPAKKAAAKKAPAKKQSAPRVPAPAV